MIWRPREMQNWRSNIYFFGFLSIITTVSFAFVFFLYLRHHTPILLLSTLLAGFSAISSIGNVYWFRRRWR
jgi:hypothetical protein